MEMGPNDVILHRGSPPVRDSAGLFVGLDEGLSAGSSFEMAGMWITAGSDVGRAGDGENPGGGDGEDIRGEDGRRNAGKGADAGGMAARAVMVTEIVRLYAEVSKRCRPWRRM